jgi:hypothetical protein
MALEGKTVFKTDIATGTSGDRQGALGHATIHNSVGSVLNNLQDDVGVDNSSDVNSLKYQINNVDNLKGKDVSTPSVNGQYLKYNSSTDDLEWDTPAGAGDMIEATYDPAGVNEQLVGLTATQTLTNKRLTSPKINEDVALTASATELNVLDGIPATLTATELGYMDGVTSAIQTQLDAKQATIALTASRAVVSSAGGVLAAATTTAAEIGYVNGVTSAIQTQINAKAPTASPSFTGDVNLATNANIQVNSADPYRVITITPGFLKPTTTGGCSAVTTVEAGTNDIDYDVLDFDATTNERAFCNFQMPDSYDGGDIQFRYVWTNSLGGAGEVVRFYLGGRAYANDSAIDQDLGAALLQTDTWIAQGDIHVSAWTGDNTLAGSPAGGQWIHLELYRDAESVDDTLTGDARLISLQIRYKQATYSE